MKQTLLSSSATAPTFSPKEIALFHFKRVGESVQVDTKTQRPRTLVQYECQRCPPTTSLAVDKTRGYQNLAQHVYSLHKDYLARMVAAKSGGIVTVARAVSDKAANVFGCLDWIVHANLPFAFLDAPRTKLYSTLKGLSYKTTRKYLSLVRDRVQSSLADDLPKTMFVMLDGWSCRNEHFIAVFGVFATNGDLRTPLLAMAPLHSFEDYQSEDPTVIAHGALEHETFLAHVLLRYDLPITAIAGLICDNCSVNRRLSKNLGVPMIGCASHRLNLAVNKFLEDYDDVIVLIKKVMISLKSLNNAVKLSVITDLKPVVHNATRWSSYYEMVRRYDALREFLTKWPTSDVTFRSLLPSAQDEGRIMELLGHLSKFNSVTKALQGAKLTVADARVLFDCLIKDYPAMATHLGQAAQIVESPTFEKAVAKAQLGKKLNATDALALRSLAASTRAATNQDEPKDYAKRALKRARMGPVMKYDDLIDLLPPTSNVVERFFSTAKFVLNPLRQGLLCDNVEAILFLKMNATYWPIDVVAQVVHDAVGVEDEIICCSDDE